MTQLSSPHLDPSVAASQMLDLLEQHRTHHPGFAAELQRHQALVEALAELSRRAEGALLGWQAALARRWSCEVAAQRAIRVVQQQLDALHGDDSLYAPLLGYATPAATRTPHGLLQSVRRLETAIELLDHLAPLAPEALARLRRAGDELEAAIGETDGCEAERRSLLSEQRLIARLVEQANERTRRLIADPDPEDGQG